MLDAINSLISVIKVNVANYKQMFAMARVDLTKRYSGSAFGVAWAIVRPTLYYFVYWFAISVGIRGSKVMEGVPYALWMIPGITAWFFLSDVITVGGSSFVNNRHLISKMVYPVETIATSEVFSLFYVHLVMMGIATAIFILSGFGVSMYLIQLPYYMLCGLALSVVLALLLSTLTAVSRDIKHVVRSIITALFWLTPSLWTVTKLSAPIKQIVLANPLAYIVTGYRNAFVTKTWFFEQWQYMLYFWGFLLVLALLTAFIYTKQRGELADVL